MELTRRDALTALGTAGVASIAGCGSLTSDGGETPSEMETMVALAEVLYPSEAEVSAEFVQTYLFGRVADEESYREALKRGDETLNGLAENDFGAPFASLETDERVSLIEGSELRTGDSVPDGSDIERVNYHLIDELLFAFYSSPTGGELVGSTNPRGYPGGFGYSPPVEQ